METIKTIYSPLKTFWHSISSFAALYKSSDIYDSKVSNICPPIKVTSKIEIISFQ